MGESDLVTPELNAPRLPRWDDDLLERRFTIAEEKPPISEGARQLDIKDNMKRHRTFSVRLSNRGQWQYRSNQSNS